MRTIAEVLRWRTKMHPDRIALCYHDRRQNYRDIDLRTSKLANALINAGARKGGRIAVLDKGHDKIIETIFAIGKMGGVYTPVNWRLTGPEITAILNDSEAEVLFVGDEYADTVAALMDRLSRVKLVIGYEQRVGTAKSYEEFLNEGDGTDPLGDVSEEDTAWQMYTSGTTGLPKGVEITHSNLISMFTGTDTKYDAQENVALASLPFFHIGGAGSTMSSFYQGARIVITRDVNPAEILDLIETEHVTHALFVPAMLNMLLQQPDIQTRDLSSLRTIIYGASPIPVDLLKQSLETFRCRFYQAYGLTETTGSVTMLMDWEHTGDMSKLRSCGLPVFGHEIRIEGDQGQICKTGDVGEIVIRGANVMKGYWKRPEETAKVLKDGWLHTGDAGFLDEDGFLYIHDRVKDMIVSGAENVYPAEVENALYAHSDIVDVAVIGVPDDRWGEAVKAIVVRREGANIGESDVIAFCKDKIAGYKQPRSVEFVDELPRNPSGKILKNKLREPYWRGRDRNVH